MKNSVVIFAGLRRTNNERFEALSAAKRLGLSVVLIGRSIPEMAKPHLLEWHECDTSDYEVGLEVARNVASRYNVIGAFSWTDLELGFIARVNQALELPGLTPESVRTIRSKFLTRQAVSSIEGVSPRFHKISTLDELHTAMDKLGYPAVVKPTGGNGSKGIFILKSEQDLALAISNLHSLVSAGNDPIFNKHGDEFIVEEYIQGQEVSVEVLVHRGIVDIIGITDKSTTSPFPFESQHVFPSAASDQAKLDVQRKIVAIIQATGCDNCTLHIEGKIENNKFTLIEINGRPGGGYITTHLVPRSTGVDHVANIIKVATGGVPDLKSQRDMSYAGIRYIFAEKEGRFLGLSGYDEAILDTGGLDNVMTEIPLGSSIILPPRSYTTHRVISVVAHAPTYEMLLKTLDEVTSSLSIKIE
ncbi:MULTISPECIES: ATP-grasp domain-containing protein [unclassified Pantoea]|uniref:ATP-grasp domain-containing protein n=1 Tax=unclassified Pantoea TaxID=2630326 RepID=UPI00301C6101